MEPDAEKAPPGGGEGDGLVLAAAVILVLRAQAAHGAIVYSIVRHLQLADIGQVAEAASEEGAFLTDAVVGMNEEVRLWHLHGGCACLAASSGDVGDAARRESLAEVNHDVGRL